MPRDPGRQALTPCCQGHTELTLPCTGTQEVTKGWTCSSVKGVSIRYAIRIINLSEVLFPARQDHVASMPHHCMGRKGSKFSLVLGQDGLVMDLSRPSQPDPRRSPTQSLCVTLPGHTKATLPRGQRYNRCSTRVPPKHHAKRGVKVFLC